MQIHVVFSKLAYPNGPAYQHDTSLKQLSDIALLDRLKVHDDRVAFDELYLRYWDAVYTIAVRKLEDHEQAKDLVHDVFVDIWYRRHTLDIHTSFAGYLYTTLSNRFIDIVRRRAVHTRMQEALLREQEQTSESAYDVIAYQELESRLMTEIDNLPAAMRQIFLLSRNEQLSAQEIADQLSLSPQTVKNQIHNALERLRAKELHLHSLALLFCAGIY